MNKQLKKPSEYDKFRGHIYQLLRRPYLFTALASYLVIALLITAYLHRPAIYKSEMALVLPGTGSSNKINLDDVGQVSSQTSTPFASKGFNPRVNYKEIIMSRGVIDDASVKTGIDESKFVVPKVVLTEQTSIINVTLSGATGKEVKEKSWALYDALQAELDRLRADEVLRRDASIQSVLTQYENRLVSSRAAILNFQKQSLLVSEDQLDQLIKTLSVLREKRLYSRSTAEEINRYTNQLAYNLGVSPTMAGQAFKLQSDTEFRSYLQELNVSTSQLSEYRSRWGNNHPKVVAVSNRYKSARLGLMNRSHEVTGLHTADIFMTLDLSENPKRSQLFADLIESYARKEGKLAEIEELEKTEILLNEKLKVYSREASELIRLKRKFELAEAVYTSAAARLEASKADVFASYPVVQLLTPPSEPILPAGPKKPVAIAAGIIGAFFITMNLLLLCRRNYFINLLLKRS